MRLARLFFGLLLVVATSRGDAASPVWQTDWKTAFRVAKEQHRLVFVAFSASWCGECHDVEMITFQAPATMEALSDFVLLRVDIDLSAIPASYRLSDLPAYVVYDADERERFRIVGKGAGSLLTVQNIEEIRRAAPALVHAAELVDAKSDLEATFLVANTYSRLKMGSRARAAYAEARTMAAKRGDEATAQIAEAQSAFTFSRGGDPSRAIKLLKRLAEKPANQETGALIWLTLGHAHEEAKERQAALESYLHAQSLAVRDSRAYVEASESIARLK